MSFEDICESLFYDQLPCWHLYTPGNLSGIIFRERKDYEFGMNLIALCAAGCTGKIRIYTFQIMSNHLHFVLSGEKYDAEEFFNELKRRLKRYKTQNGTLADLKGFNCSLSEIGSLSYLRNVITYVNRNGYLVNKEYTPFSYPWGGNRYYFNELAYPMQQTPVNKITVRRKREIFRSANFCIPSNWYLTGNYISPLCYLHIQTAEGFFRNAHHYFNLVSRRVETFAQIARELGDLISYTDEELNTAYYAICSEKYGSAPKTLNKQQKIEIAKELHFNYNASNKQIRRLLRLEEHIINEMFPGSRK